MRRRPSDTIALAARDSLGNTAAGATIAVTVNGLPVIAAPSTAVVGVGQATAVTGLSLSEIGNTTGETFTATLTDTNGLLSATGTGVTGSGTKALTITGSLAQMNADLATVKDTDATTPSDTIALAATDSLGNTAAGATIAVTVNGLPVIAAPSTAVVGVGQATAVTGLSLSEIGNTAGETFTATLTDTNGLLSATGTGVTGSGTKGLTITGSLAQVNSDLATLNDTDATTPSDTIALTATDSLGNQAAAASVAVTVNGLPVIAAPTTATVGVGQATAITGLSLSETGTTTGETFTVTLADTNGLLSATGTGVSGSGTKALTVTGTLAQVNADLATVKDTDAATPSDTIALAATDSLGNQAAAASVAVTVNGLPVIAAPATATIGVGQAKAITGLSLSETGTATGETFTVTLADTSGLLSATGIGVTGSGTKALTITGSLAQVNADLATVKDTDAVTPSDKVTIAATDSFGNHAAAKTIAVTVNGLPVIAAPTTATVGVGQATPITELSLSETGTTTGETFTVTLADTNGLLSATGTGVTGSGTKALTVTGSLAQVNADLATVKATDAATPSDTITLAATDSFGNHAAAKTIAATVNGLPVIAAPTTATVGVGQATAITGLSLSETGTTTGETFTVTLADTNGLLSATGSGVSGAGTTSLSISGSLTTVNADLATVQDTDTVAASDEIVAQATDSLGGVATTATVAITVTPLRVPTITAPTDLTLGQAQSGAVAGVSLSETGSTGSETFTVTLADTNGLLAATGMGVSGSGTTALTIAGTLAQVNTDLATLSDVDTTAGADIIAIGAVNSLGGQATAAIIAVTVNGLPAIAAPTTATVGVGQATAITGLSLSETGTTTGETFTVTLADTNGLLSATGIGVTGSGTKALTVTGSLAQVNADLATVQDTDATTPSDTIVLAAADSLGNQAAAASVAVTVNGLPVIAAPATATVGAGQAKAITGLSLSETGTTTGETFTVTLADTNGLLSATGTGVSGSGTKALTVTGTLAQVNADLATVKDTDTVTPSDKVTVAATNSFGNHAAAKTIAVTVNGLPVIAAPTTATVGAGQAKAITGLSLSETGTTTGETFTVTLADTNGLLSATGTGVSGSGTKALTVTGTLAQVNADLATVKDTDTVTSSDKVTIAAADSFGNHAAAKTIAVTVNGLPVIAAPTTAIVGVGQATPITGLSLSETGTTTGETFTVTLADTNGLLSATGTGVAGSGTKALTVTGSLAQVNTDLATVQDTDATTPSDTIALAATDSLGNQAAAASVAVTVNGLPVLAAPATATVGVGQAKAITGLSLSETGTTTGETFTVTLGDTNGLLSATGTGVSGSGTKALTVTGSLAQVNADLATVQDTDATTPSDTIALAAIDSFGNQAAAASVAVTVNGLPVLVAPATATVGVGQAKAIAGLSLSETGTTTAETFTVTLADTNGLLSATGTGVSGSGTKALTVTGSLAQVNADLATVKDTDTVTPSDTITLAATDSFGNHAAAKTVAVTVNGLPVIAAPATTTVGAGQATAITGLSLSETGTTTGETFTVTLGDTNGLLSATGTGVSGSGTKVLTATGTLAQVNADLATVEDTDTVTPADTIALSATDSLGNTATGAAIAVTVTGGTITLTPAPVTITATGNDTINAPSNTLNSHDSINAGPGTNTLNLVGSGFFDLGAPSTLSNIQIVTAQESAVGTYVYMRNDLNVALTVAPAGSGSIAIYGGTDADGYTLGVGSDTVVLGAATETVTAGGGTGLVQATAAFAGALVNGGSVASSGSTTLEITTGGTATLNSADTNLIVKLDAATNLSLGAATFITAEGAASGGDTITAGGANQILESIGGNDTLVGSSSFSDTFMGTAAGFSGDIIQAFGGSDAIDFTDILYGTFKSLGYTGGTTSGTLVAADSTHSATVTLDGSYTSASFTPLSDGHGGTLIHFV